MTKIARLGAIALITLTFPSALAQQPTPTPVEYFPNDPKLDVTAARVINLLAAYAKILSIEQTSQPKMQQAVIAMLEEWVDCTHPEFQGKCLANLAWNATDQPYQNDNIHGMGAAGTGMAATDNGMGVASPGGFMNRVKFFPIKVCESNLCKPEWVQAGLTKVLEYKRAGIPIVVVGCNFATGVVDPAGMDTLLKALDAEQIDLIAPGPNNLPPQNIDGVNIFPASYGDRYPNIISVTAGDATGTRLLPASAYGPKQMNLVAPGDNVKTISILDPNGSASISGSSAVTEQIAAAYALVRVYREPDSAKARFILKFTARMYTALEGKLAAALGDTGDAGRMAGKIDIYDALALPFGCPAPSSNIMWVTKRDTSKAIALVSVFGTAGPFSLAGQQNTLNPDGKIRVILFAYNIGQNVSTASVQAKDSTGQTLSLPVEFLGNLSDPLSCVNQLNVNLATSPRLAAGDVTLTITAGAQKSGEAVVTIKP